MNEYRTPLTPFDGWTTAEREAICRWIELHGVDPARVPEDHAIRISDTHVSFDLYDLAVTDGSTPPRRLTLTTITTELRAPWPLDNHTKDNQ